MCHLLIRRVGEVLWAGRVLYAMDYPYQCTPAEVTARENLPITPAEKADLFQHNAERLFALRTVTR